MLVPYGKRIAWGICIFSALLNIVAIVFAAGILK
jgi:hypothetical protein